MASLARKQDMPPGGGYKSIPYKRVPAKKIFSAPVLFGGYLAMTAGAAYVYHLNYLQVQREDLELRAGRLAIHPLLLAERDREYLKQLRRNRDEEAELMKNVEGWKVGTWYGEPIYETKSEALIEPNFYEYYIHTDSWSRRLRSYFPFLS